MELVAVTSAPLPAPHLSLMTSGAIYMGQEIQLQCTAPENYPEGTFHLYSHSTGEQLQTAQAPETKNSVMFTIQSSYAMKSIECFCKYQCYVGNEIQVSEVSNVLSVTINVPVWVFVVVGLVGLLILVASVLVTVYLLRRNKKKKQEERDKDSIWIDQQMTPDWSDGNHNMVYDANSVSKTDISNTYLSNVDSQMESRSPVPFSSFRT
ncbi:protein HIDE1 isoform X2 [Eleutherodactylus coqui]|uniref:C19orf38 Ig domain-containing protein n=2 Tax=Eleutherodactylus coqui TaxID=57060 RepID=A0A8J6EKV5_ELECQ|nr:hypothetical protein GDO78_016726 [Eleutherodactylus coqui]